MTGLHLAQYRIDAELGRGGMGVVYLATDTKLNRKVALKVLPASALASDDDRTRFFREAQAAAQLSHPNVCHVYQVDEAIPLSDSGERVTGHDEARLFIAMEYIEGDTVREVIEKGPMKLQDAVNIAGQIAEALKEAHAKQIVHRDIKSANVMLTAAGVAKVLDFGLAKTQASTMLTRMGSTLGTVAYMSPEQARGQEVDGRSDLYSLGTVLYEMVAGRLPYAADYEQAVLYGILNEPPEPLTALRTGVPMQLEWLVGKLLAKDPEYRYQTAGDLLADLKSLDLSGSGMSRRSMSAVSATQMSAQPAAAGSGLPKWIWGALAGVLLAGLAAGWLLRPVPESKVAPVRNLTVTLPQFQEIIFPSGSSDGRYWMLAGTDSAGVSASYLWDVRAGVFRPLEGSENMFFPQFSPDGSWVLLAGGDGLYRVRVPSGRTLFADSLTEGTWLDNETILGLETGSLKLFRVSVENQSRTPIPVDDVDSTYSRFFELWVDRASNVAMVTAQRDNGAQDVLSVDLSTGRVVTLVRGACCARPHLGRYLVYMVGTDTDGRLVAQRLSDDGMSVSGVPVDLVSESMDDWYYGLGEDDTFFVIDREGIGTEGGERISVLDPDTGVQTMLPFAAANYDRLAVSPDARKIVVERIETTGPNSGRNLFVFDIESGTEQRLTYRAVYNQAPVWTRSNRIFYASGPSETRQDVYVKNADGTGAEVLVAENARYPSVSADERWLAFQRDNNLFAMDLRDGTIVPIDTTAGKHGDAAISPNGAFIAYTYDSQLGNTVSGNQRMFVRSFPDPSIQFVQAVEEKADDPLWSPDGRTLYFRDNGRISRVAVQTDGVFMPRGTPSQVATFASNTPRLAIDPVTGHLVVMRPGDSQASRRGPRIHLTLSFSRFIEDLMSDAEPGS